ncbi:MAG TPA: hypothetical protein VMS38_14520 [Pseudorhodoferax sp.]|nr:hypothetical protein [Pseudorhodoferax sp.]
MPHALARTLLIACAIAVGGAAHASEARAQDKLAFVRQLPYQGAWPSLAGFSPAQPVPDFKAPAGDHGHTAAYRSADGCVAFFYPPGEEGISGVALKWKGPACNGKPLQGEGELQILRRAGTGTVVGVLQGRFANGLLAGQGSKANFSYDAAGQPLPDTYLFEGEFLHSVLHGQGISRWSGAADARPTAWARQGRFHEGLARGLVAQARLRPYPGVEAEVQDLWFGEDGTVPAEQARVNRGRPVPGLLFFENDAIAWRSEVAAWRDGQFQTARLLRMDTARQAGLVASCVRWRFEARQLRCDQGAVSSGGASGELRLDDGPYTLPWPVRPGGTGFRPGPGAALHVALQDAQTPVRCNAELSRCTGRGAIPILGAGEYWWGDLEWREGSLQPVAAALHARGADDGTPATAPQRPGYAPQSDAVLARCTRFAGPLQCAEGLLRSANGTRYSGAWVYDGVRFGSDAGPARYEALPGDRRVRRTGWGTNTYADGRWAEVHFDDDGAMDAVGLCEHPGRGGTVNCHLQGRTVVFTTTR